MKPVYFFFLVVFFSCGTSSKDEKQAANEVVTQRHSFGAMKIESAIAGKNAKTYWQEGLTAIEYRLFRNDSLKTTFTLAKEDFFDLYSNRTFSVPARIWESDILAVDDQRGLIAIRNRFGPPDSDNLTDVIVVADLQGNKTYRDSPLECSSGITVSFNRIVDCNGVYDFNTPLIEYTGCCTVFSGLLNESVLFYLKNTTHHENDNAFLVNVYTKDTLEHFLYEDITEALTYSALVSIHKEMGILAVLQRNRGELTLWDEKLKKRTYALAALKSVPDLIPIGNFIEMKQADADPVIIEFDADKRPTRWNQ